MERMKAIRHLVILFAALAALPAVRASEFFVYSGTYTREKSKGIYVARFDTATGKLGQPGLAGEVVNASFLTIHPNGRFLYAVSETYGQGGQRTGAVRGFSVDPASGKLKLLNTVASNGTGPCFVVVDKT